MIKVLIVDNNIIHSKNFLNSIINKFEELQLVYIANSNQETIDILLNTHIDLIFWTILNNDELNFIEELTINEIPQIIVISKNDNLLKEAIKINYVCEVLDKTESYDSVIEKITHFLDHNNNIVDVQNFILSELNYMGYDIKYKGTQYILESIMYVYQKNDFDLLDNVEQNIYKFIGDNHNKTINNIKTNINKATYARKKDKILKFELTAKKTIITVLSKLNQKFR